MVCIWCWGVVVLRCWGVFHVFCMEEKLPYIKNLISKRQNNFSTIYNFLNNNSTLFLKVVKAVWLVFALMKVMWIHVDLATTMFVTFYFAFKCYLKVSVLLSFLLDVFFNEDHVNFAEYWTFLHIYLKGSIGIFEKFCPDDKKEAFFGVSINFPLIIRSKLSNCEVDKAPISQ